jgi:DNA helicase-2/ATP-dependent DNA helicase PcrA
MPIRPEQIAAAEAVQHAAAHDQSPTVRLVAGPGTGKSTSVEERVQWLIREGIPAKSICVVSFTRAAALELRLNIHRYALTPGYETITDVRVTTLHSLALRVLRRANQLVAYPADPLVLDDWELENIFDEEFAQVHNLKKQRREEIRLDHEAFWSTGEWLPANYLPPDPPITDGERTNFVSFHGPRTLTYACVLPGEIIRLCVREMETGLLDAVDLLEMSHLIVDEFQDLNPLDLKFVDHLIKQGATVFVAGDDDQSVYAFRFASPSGIQTFHTTYPSSGIHELAHCFRCTPVVLSAATALMAAFPGPGRIPKHLTSLYAASAPPVAGTVCRWKFISATAEAKAVAESCRKLLDAGTNPRDILILLGNQRTLSQPLMDELGERGIAAEHPREESFIDSDAGRLVLALLRVVGNADDYVAHRTILCQRRGIGIGRCTAVFDSVFNNNLNFRAMFYDPLPGGVFAGMARSTLNHARATCAAISTWQPDDTLIQRSGEISQIIESHYSPQHAATWQAFAADLPEGLTLEEVCNLLWATTDEQQSTILQAAMVRLGMPIPVEGVLPARVRIMTMHGAKGLAARVVFIPGLEEEVFPGAWREPFPGLVYEAARLLYVSITRARAACILSFATRRTINGTSETHTRSRFAPHLGGAFSNGPGSLSDAEVAQIMTGCSNLFPPPLVADE